MIRSQQIIPLFCDPLQLPSQLQKQLLEEGELITNKGKLLPPVPRKPSAKEILYQFVLSKEPLDQVEQKL